MSDDFLLGDVGGTHARFCLGSDLGRPPDLTRSVSLPSRDYASLEAALQAFFDRETAGRWPRRAAIALAGPVRDGAVEFTNLNWRVDSRALAAPGRFEDVRLLNDFAAAALSLPVLTDEDLMPLGPARRAPTAATLAVMGPGTGFGVAALVRDGASEAVLGGEGGHVAFAPGTDLEIDVLRILRARFGRVSLERLVSGPGLVDVHQALCVLAGAEVRPQTPESLSAAAAAGDARASEALDLVCAVFGAAAGDFALAFGALGGVFVTGGVALNLKARLASGPFRSRFEDKGRFRDYLSAIPTHLILHPTPNLLGAWRALAQTAP